MDDVGLSEEQAYKHLRKLAMDMFKREGLMSDERRQFIKGSAALAAGSAVNTGAWAAGSDAPRRRKCASASSR
jgi:hypothetical protein